MSFGTTVPNRGAPLFTPEEMRTQAREAEAMGFDHIWASDHVVLPVHVAPRFPYSSSGVPRFVPEQPYSDPLTVLANLAGCTERIRLGTGVLVLPYRAPVLTAKIISTLDYMSGGRVILGVGAGWLEEEFVALGLDTFHERGKVTDEYIRIFKELWTKDDPEFQGHYYQFSGIKFYPKPVQKPHVPIWVGGNSRAGLRRAARMGDGWTTAGFLSLEEMDGPIQQLRDLTERAGRPRDAVEIAYSADLAFDPPRGETRRSMTGGSDDIAADIAACRQVGVQHIKFNFEGGTLAQKLWK